MEDSSPMEFETPSINVTQIDDPKNHDPANGDDFEAAVELDERMLSFPASGVDSFSASNQSTINQLYRRIGGSKKVFSVMKYKKKLKKDTSLMFDERPHAS